MAARNFMPPYLSVVNHSHANHGVSDPRERSLGNNARRDGGRSRHGLCDIAITNRIGGGKKRRPGAFIAATNNPIYKQLWSIPSSFSPPSAMTPHTFAITQVGTTTDNEVVPKVVLCCYAIRRRQPEVRDAGTAA